MTEPLPSILLVDDDVAILEGFRRILRDGYEVHVAASGAQALGIMQRLRVDVLVTDEHMPGMSGLELVEQVRIRYPATMRIMMTGEASLDLAMKAINVGGVFRFLAKPCSPADLRGALVAAVAVCDRKAVQSQADARLFDSVLDGLWMAAQPIVNVETGAVHAYEMLVRTNVAEYPHGGAIVSAAERVQRIPELEARAIGHVARLMPDAPHGAEIYVNLHPLSLASSSNLESLVRPLAPFASRVILEVTERASLDDPEALHGLIAGVRKMGFRIAVDDLGAGHAGLTYVAALKPEVVKLDMGIVRRVPQPEAVGMIGAIASACNDLGISVVAEGIETAAARDRLAALGCSLQQGYFFARPAAPFARLAA